MSSSGGDTHAIIRVQCVSKKDPNDNNDLELEKVGNGKILPNFLHTLFTCSLTLELSLS